MRTQALCQGLPGGTVSEAHAKHNAVFATQGVGTPPQLPLMQQLQLLALILTSLHGLSSSMV